MLDIYKIINAHQVALQQYKGEEMYLYFGEVTAGGFMSSCSVILGFCRRHFRISEIDSVDTTS